MCARKEKLQQKLSLHIAPPVTDCEKRVMRRLHDDDDAQE